MKHLKKISIIFGAILLMFSSLSAVSTQERDALVALYNSTDGNSWTDNSNWNTGDPCTDNWYGVACNDGNIVTLALYSNQLTGIIPPEIGNLTSLSYLYLHYNQLTGSIPSEIGNLTSLSYLYLHYNQLTGSIPPEIGNLTSLSYLYLYSNQLTGSIPSEIGNLTNLQYLYLYENCSLYSDDIAIQQFIDDVEYGGTYQDILDTNTYDCDKPNPILAPIIMYLLN